MPLGALLSLGAGALSAGMSGIQWIEPAKRGLTYGMNQLMPNLIPELGVWITMYKQGETDYNSLKLIAANFGYDEKNLRNIMSAMQVYLSIGDYIRLYRRGVIDYKQLELYANMYFITKSNLEDMLKATEYFPGPDDLVRFAVRDVYSPNAVKTFRLLDDFPDKFGEEALKVGVPLEQAKNYWASHWQLPSANMGFEMYQRNIISYSELELLLKTLDISPFWRDKLVKLNYNPLTRVDVRRMWQVGVITEYDDLQTQYKNVGYSPENAKRLADFTIKLTDNEMSGITRENIGSSYLSGYIGEDTLIDLLTRLDKSETFINFWSMYYIMKRTDNLVKEREAQIIDMYKEGGVTYDEIRQILIDDGASTEYIGYMLRRIQSYTYAKIKQPSLADVLRWFEKGVIGDLQFTIYMRKLNYTDDTIQHYLVDMMTPDEEQKRKYLTPTQYIGFFKKGIMDQQTVTEVLAEMGVNGKDINALIMQALLEVQNAGS